MKQHTTESNTTLGEHHNVAHSPIDAYQRAVAGGPPIRRLPIGLRILTYMLATLFTAGIIAGLVISLLG
ncbi:hypothetical protein [Exiguobacterium acetylicum]|uniref:hypothetical protein n=1 Tax=Exiguobacterium acetylicum TaxID=41170 RepID=UPI001EE22E58|nr:hypothetical protein [Exiguobacterium acetylicum]UKS54573.1 hypothetical protein K6T22_08355 [Exiguobacterium acetylicum]